MGFIDKRANSASCADYVSSIFCVGRFARHAEREQNSVMEIGQEIRRRRKALGMTLEDLEALVGIDNGNLSRIERGKQGYTPETLEKIATALGCTVSELYAGITNVEELPHLGKIPQVSWVAAGQFSEASDPFPVGLAEDWWICPVKHGPRTFALKVKGLSMFNPNGSISFSEGNIIFVDPDRGANHGSLIVARLEDSNEVTFKKLIVDGERRYLEALNPAWPERIIEINERATICGVVIAKLEPFL